jgi:hypothetical protein
MKNLLVALARILREDTEFREVFLEKMLRRTLEEKDVEEVINSPTYFWPFFTGLPYNGPLDWPKNGETMTSLQNLLFLKDVCEDVHMKKIEGDIVETGLWRGGCLIYMKLCFNFFKDFRIAHGFDSFIGCPTPDIQTEKDKSIESSALQCRWNEHFTVSKQEVEQNFLKYGIKREEFNLIEGWFHETVPVAKIDHISILRLDGDCYSSTEIVLDNLYEKVSVGGYIIIDDFDLECCALAVEDFRKRNEITTPITYKDGGVGYWLKE